MHTVPTTIETAVTAQLLTPLAEVLTGQRSAALLDPVLGRGVAHRLARLPRRARGRCTVRTVRIQAIGDGALEVAAIVEANGRVHPLGVRIERVDGAAHIVALATSL